MVLPMRAFCFRGYEGSIELVIDEVFGFPHSTSYEGGYDMRGTLRIRVGAYQAYCNNFYFATGVLYRFLEGLQVCYDTLEGKAIYQHYLENDLAFTLEMTQRGHGFVAGHFQENPSVENRLYFTMSTDQTCVRQVIEEIKEVKQIFGGYHGMGTVMG